LSTKTQPDSRAVALGIEIAEEQLLLQPLLDAPTARVTLRVTKVSPRLGLS
jgi:hypothetical protein